MDGCRTNGQLIIGATGAAPAFADLTSSGATIAEGESQTTCFFQTTFNCAAGPADPFKHHLDSYVCDAVENIVECGTRFADPDNPLDDIVAFPVVAADGTVVYDPTKQPFQFVDVWNEQPELIAVCDEVTGTGTSP